MILYFVAVLCFGVPFEAAFGYKTECYPDLGCFTNAPPWGNTNNRPSNMPEEPSKVNTRFFLDTTTYVGLEINYSDMAALSATSFDSAKMTRVIVHGYQDGDGTNWMETMSRDLRQAEDVNVIRVTWEGASMDINYDKSAVNAQIAGASLGLLVQNMKQSFGMTKSMFHCIGHSLGAHVCAYAANRADPLGRISGLDPAGIYFEGTEAVVRLEYSDADLVDIIHTDANPESGYGTSQQSGHIDFWPNGGEVQPGCDQGAVIGWVDGIIPGDWVECNHMRAIDFFTESILTSCPFKSYPCQNYQNFTEGICLACEDTGCPQQGYHADLYEGQVHLDKTYLTTASESPFCEYMTYVSISLGQKTRDVLGSLYITLVGTKGASEKQQLGGKGQLYWLLPGSSYKDQVFFKNDPGDVTSVIIEWKEDGIELVSMKHITIDQIAVWKGDLQIESRFCDPSGETMKDKTPYQLSTTC